MAESKEVESKKDKVPPIEGQRTQAGSSNKLVLIAKKPEETWEDFEQRCVKAFSEAGLLKDMPLKK